MSGAVTVVQPGPLTTVQDLGRPGQAALGIGRSGACDRGALRLANRLVGNDEGAAVLEVTMGGLELRADTDVLLALTGARCPGGDVGVPLALSAGQRLRLGAPATGVRTYVAVRGGFDVPPVLGSRSTDLLAGIGPQPLSGGQQLSVGSPSGPAPGVDLAPVEDPPGGPVELPVLPGPRQDWFTPDAWRSLLGQAFTVSPQSNRVGVRLDGVPLERSGSAELPSEGMERGALQVPPSGLPIVFLADHPVTGGYPVIGYVVDDAVDRCGQLRVGQQVRFTG